MSPMPRRFSAPFASRIVRESVLEDTWKDMREGRFALIRPVITSTLGRWVATIRWMPAARAIWARRMIESSTSRGNGHHEVRKFVDDHDDVGQALGLGNGLVVGVDVLVPFLRELSVPPLHLGNDGPERLGCFLGLRDHGREQVRNAVRRPRARASWGPPWRA